MKTQTTQRDLSHLVKTKEARKLKEKQNSKHSMWFGLGMFGLVGWSVAVPTLLGTVLGIWLDRAGRQRRDDRPGPAVEPLVDRRGLLNRLQGKRRTVFDQDDCRQPDGEGARGGAAREAAAEARDAEAGKDGEREPDEHRESRRNAQAAEWKQPAVEEGVHGTVLPQRRIEGEQQPGDVRDPHDRKRRPDRHHRENDDEDARKQLPFALVRTAQHVSIRAPRQVGHQVVLRLGAVMGDLGARAFAEGPSHLQVRHDHRGHEDNCEARAGDHAVGQHELPEAVHARRQEQGDHKQYPRRMQEHPFLRIAHARVHGEFASLLWRGAPLQLQLLRAHTGDRKLRETILDPPDEVSLC